jgi:hypothetical protein
MMFGKSDDYYHNWHTIFAWLPKRITCGKEHVGRYAWLCKVERRLARYSNGWQYRYLPPTPRGQTAIVSGCNVWISETKTTTKKTTTLEKQPNENIHTDSN